MSLGSGAPYWRPSESGQPLRQCEMLADVEHVTLALADVGSADEIGVITTQYTYALVLSQDCDLEWDHRARERRDAAGPRPANSGTRVDWDASEKKDRSKLMSSILLCAAEEEAVVKAGTVVNGEQWKFAKTNQHERYHLLRPADPAVDAEGAGFPALVLDFKRYIAIPADELRSRVALTGVDPGRSKRRAFLVSPFLEEVTARFYNYQSRVALPDEARGT